MLVWLKEKNKRTIIFLTASLISLFIGFFNIFSLPVNLSWIAVLLCGLPIMKGAAEGLIKEFDVKADVLVSIALAASVCIGEIFAAGEIAFIMALGAYIEERTVSKSRAGIERLVNLKPSTARVVISHNETRIIEAKDVKKGVILRVLAGETIPVDGKIVKGSTSVDQSIMTGESLPVDKEEGDEVLSGTVNMFGSFDMIALKVGEDGSLQRMIRLVESADAGKAKIVRLADKWATHIVFIALICAAATWFVSGEIIRGVTILVVFCPCALVLATPTAIVAAIGNAAKCGALIKEGDALEKLAKVNCMAFDKTGTLTKGVLTVTKIESVNPDMSSVNILKIAAKAEVLSEHPIGKAVTSYYKNMTGEVPDDPDKFQMMPGYGVCAQSGGEQIFAGNEKLLKRNGIILSEEILKKITDIKKCAGTVVYVASGKELLGYIVLSDILRENAADIIKDINDCGIETVLITGDNYYSAENISSSAGIKKFKSECLPEDKINEINLNKKNNGYVCMIGDGINDAPALKAADVGISMGDIGSDIAIGSSDIVLTGDNIKEIPRLLKLAKKTMRTIKINLTASMVLNFVSIALAMAGILTPVLGALVHNAGSVAVILNSSLLLKWSPSRRQTIKTLFL
ncbi:MAG: cation-translocating P-type ATPase [Endomicrobium sp.]|jgi:heavy metal translocating P-type ATPase|nr:cation-translocating P-type ATPase [Endomicrobium sp.]